MKYFSYQNKNINYIKNLENFLRQEFPDIENNIHWKWINETAVAFCESEEERLIYFSFKEGIKAQLFSVNKLNQVIVLSSSPSTNEKTKSLFYRLNRKLKEKILRVQMLGFKTKEELENFFWLLLGEETKISYFLKERISFSFYCNTEKERELLMSICNEIRAKNLFYQIVQPLQKEKEFSNSIIDEDYFLVQGELKKEKSTTFISILKRESFDLEKLSLKEISKVTFD